MELCRAGSLARLWRPAPGTQHVTVAKYKRILRRANDTRPSGARPPQPKDERWVPDCRQKSADFFSDPGDSTHCCSYKRAAMFATPERAGAGSESREEKPVTTQAMRRAIQGRKTVNFKSKALRPCFFVCARSAAFAGGLPGAFATAIQYSTARGKYGHASADARLGQLTAPAGGGDESALFRRERVGRLAKCRTVRPSDDPTVARGGAQTGHDLDGVAVFGGGAHAVLTFADAISLPRAASCFGNMCLCSHTPG